MARTNPVKLDDIVWPKLKAFMEAKLQKFPAECGYGNICPSEILDLTSDEYLDLPSHWKDEILQQTESYLAFFYFIGRGVETPTKTDQDYHKHVRRGINRFMNVAIKRSTMPKVLVDKLKVNISIECDYYKLLDWTSIPESMLRRWKHIGKMFGFRLSVKGTKLWIY